MNKFPKNHYTDNYEYYHEVYLKSDHWKELKAAKLRINSCCERCKSQKRIEVHHLQYKNLYDVLLEDLETLCRKCHKKEHGFLDSLKPRKSPQSYPKKQKKFKHLNRAKFQNLLRAAAKNIDKQINRKWPPPFFGYKNRDSLATIRYNRHYR